MTRTGKVARLSRAVREALNRRLQDGEMGARLVDWLNGQSEVRAVLAQHFDGRPVSEQNLSEWKQGGYREWEEQQAAGEAVRSLMEQSAGLTEAAEGALISEKLATVLIAELTRQVQRVLAEKSDSNERWEHLQAALGSLAKVRREETNAGRLRLEQQRWQAKDQEHTRKLASNEMMFPFYAVMLQQAFGGLIGNDKEAMRAEAEAYLGRELQKRKAQQSSKPEPRPAADSSLFKPTATASPGAGKTKSNQIK